MKRCKGLIAGLLAAAAVGAQADLSETSTFLGVNLAIPDYSPSGVRDTRTIASDIAYITSLQVHLKITGNFNGDLYVYLQHQSGLTVLLNRVGRTATSPFGYIDSGFDVTFSDSAANDIHNYEKVATPAAGSPLTGTWQPDGRFVNPTAVLDTSPRTTFLTNFNGLAASGTWVLFLADLDPGGLSTLNSWSLQITGMPQTTTTIGWANPAPMVYGTPLGAGQLNATASAPGSFVYNPPAGTLLDAGTGRTLLVTFIPNNTNAYSSATAAVSLDVWPGAAVGHRR